MSASLSLISLNAPGQTDGGASHAGARVIKAARG